MSNLFNLGQMISQSKEDPVSGGGVDEGGWDEGGWDDAGWGDEG